MLQDASEISDASTVGGAIETKHSTNSAWSRLQRDGDAEVQGQLGDSSGFPFLVPLDVPQNGNPEQASDPVDALAWTDLKFTNT